MPRELRIKTRGEHPAPAGLHSVFERCGSRGETVVRLEGPRAGEVQEPSARTAPERLAGAQLVEERITTHGR